MTEVTKEYTFDCAHQLVGYDGLCSNVHGHTYKLQVTVTGDIITDTNSPKEGMIVDFNELKEIVKVAVLNDFDHAFIACGDEPILQALINSGCRVTKLNIKTTCENMVKIIAERIQNEINKTNKLIRVKQIKLWETPTSFATYTTN
jgi:6-pyruvoyltetrahydropterin/6-carboxytetrahydropterin synthase